MLLRSAGLPIIALIATAVASPASTQAEPALVMPPAPDDDLPRGQFRTRPFGAADGLRNLIVLGIAQDGDGMLWVATDDGVYRYDGQQFTHYSMQDGLPAMGVRVLGIAPDGALCAGTRDGMACWNGARFSPRGAEGVPRTSVQVLAAGPGVLWAGTTEGLLVRRGSGAFEPAPGWPVRPLHPVRAIWADAEGVVVGDDAALALSAGDGVWRRLGPEVGLGGERIESVLRDRDGALWIRSVHHLWTLPRGAPHVVDLSDGLPAGSDSSGVACGMAISPWGDVLVGSAHGIARRRPGRWELLDASTGLPARDARALLVDREGTVWIGSMGLFQWMGRGLIDRHNMATGLPDDTVWTIGRDRRDGLWLGTAKCLTHAIDGRWSCLPASVGWSVRTFVFPPQGGVFVGGGRPDLLYVDPAGQSTTLELQGEVADRHIMAATLGPEGDLWLATTSGLYRLPGAQPGRPERVAIPGTRIDGRFISVLAVDDRLWTAGDSGLAVLDHGTWRLLDRSSGFRASAMRHVIRRHDGRMCVSFTDVDGLTCFRWDGDRASDLVDISLADGLTSGRIYFLGEDRERRLWIGTGDGVDVVTASGVDHFDETDGLAGNDSTARAFFEDGDGSIWLGASTGVTHVQAQHYRGPPIAPRTTVLGSALGGSPVPAGAAAAIQVPHERNSVAASFAADSFIDPRRLEFQVRLSPLETEWSTTRLREARYPALPPGSYQLEMRARTGAGAWGPPAELRFAVLPAWWQTRWFIVIAGGLALAALGGAVTWRQRVLWRRRARQLTQQSDARFRELIEAMPDLVSVHRDDQLIYLNQAARRMLGADANRAPRQVDLVDRIHPDDRRRAARLFRDAQSDTQSGAHGSDAQSQGQAVEIRLAAADRSWRRCELSGRRIDLGDGPVVVVTGRDVTERDRLRAKLLLSDRMASLGTLAAGIAHEINNPLAYVSANLEVVAESLAAAPAVPSPGPDAERAERDELLAALGDAREGAERVRKIVRGLRSFSRSEEEKRVPIALSDVLSAAIRLTGNELKHRAVLVLDLAPTPAVLADDGRLTQVFINLLINAAHAIPEGNTDANRIHVRTRTAPDGRAIVEIEDTGAGMPPEVLARAFDPFFTTKEVGEGTGLGLSICHGIISGLGGQITIDSAPGRGCLVRVVLPQATTEAHLAPPAAPAIAELAPRRRRVLIIDDEPRVAQALERMLHADYDLTLVSCGASALEHVTAGIRYDAIITDVMMPNMTGVELFDRLEILAPDQAHRVIFLTGGVFTPQTQARLEAAGNPQLQKPVGAQELRACVAKLLAGPRRAERVSAPPVRDREASAG